MTRQHDPLDQLIREALGEPANPAPARRACRAALRLVAANEGRKQQRLNGLAMVASLVLAIGLAAPLGSNDFNRHVDAYSRNGREIREYSYGLDGEKMGSFAPDIPGGVPEDDMDEIAQQRAAGEGRMVALWGFQIGSLRHFSIMTEYVVNGKFRTSSTGVQGMSDESPPELKAWFKKAGPGSRQRLMEFGEQHEPDAVQTMRFNGLDWIVSSWRIHFAGMEVMIFYRGLRADGVRSQDPEGV